MTIPPAVSQIMSENTVYLLPSGCSGFLIRNPAGQPIGVQTAQHCGAMSQQDGDWGTNANGQPTVTFNSPMGVETGDTIDSLTDIGDITELALSAPTDATHDLALGALGDNSMPDVLANYNQMTPAQVAALQPGDVIYNSGWPQFEANNSGPRKREEFAMSVLGTSNITTTKGDNLNVLWAAVPESADGAECSFGDSGSAGFTLDQEGQPLIIGPLSGFDDFGLVLNQNDPAAAASARTYYENEFGVDLTGYSAVCSFDIGPLSTSSEVTAQVVAPEGPEGTPPPTPLENLEQQYTADFFNPDFTRQVINGMVVITGLKGSRYIDRPAVYYDPSGDGTTLLAWCGDGDASSPDSLHIQALLGNDALQSVSIYSDNDGQTDPDLINSTGAVAPSNDTQPGTPGFTDANGLHFGIYNTDNPLSNDPATDASQSTLSIVNGQLRVNLVSNPYRNQEADEAAAVTAFNNPNAAKQVINGTVVLPVGSEETGTVINRPYVYYNSDDGSVVVGYSTTKDGGQLDTYYYPSPSDILFYPDSTADPVTVATLTGQVSFQGDPSGQTDGGYVTTYGYSFGQQVVNPPTDLTTGAAYQIVVNADGSLSMAPATKGGG
ncbi:MAG TPA: hypothetical protein VK712_03090 [Verrucomicrobiae bacterium]|nr:hypothetical protein [Verrucomicrobiae bacterium]